MEKLKCNICQHIDGEILTTSTGSCVISVDPSHYKDDSNITKIMIEKKCCFSCAFWEQKVSAKDENTFITKMGHYHSNEPYVDKTLVRGFLGYGGHDFYIKKDNGTYFHANNLWFQGEIPDVFQDKLPINSEFVTKEEYETNK